MLSPKPLYSIGKIEYQIVGILNYLNKERIREHEDKKTFFDKISEMLGIKDKESVNLIQFRA